MNLPTIPIPTNDKSKTAEMLRKMDAEAKVQGKSGWLEPMIEQSPDMADIFARMIGAELKAIKDGRRTPGCELCEPNSATF